MSTFNLLKARNKETKKNKPTNLESKSVKFDYRKVLFPCLSVLSFLIFILFALHDGKEWIDFKNIGVGISISPHIYAVRFIGVPIAIFLASAGFSFSGFAMQTVSRNPLASPTTLGYMPAAILGLLVSKIITTNENYVPIIIGILFSTAIIALNYFMMRGNFMEISFKPILIGFAIGGMLNSTIVLLNRFVDVIHFKEIGFLVSPIKFSNLIQLYVCGSIILVSCAVFLILCPYYSIIEKDIILAKSLGIKVELVFWSSALFSVFTTVACIVIVGPLSLIGMITPHIARILNPKGKAWENIMLGFVCSLALISASRWLLDVVGNFHINFFSAVAALPVFGYIFFSKRFRKNVD